MKRNTKYVGLDVHQAMTVATVRSQGGRVIARSVIETSDESIREFFAAMAGSVHVVFEEGTQAQWLYDLLSPRVDQVIVCDRRGEKRSGNKEDQVDADELSEQLRCGGLRAVYHGAHGRSDLKELTRAYRNLVEDGTRVMLRLKALGYVQRPCTLSSTCFGLSAPSATCGPMPDSPWSRARALTTSCSTGDAGAQACRAHPSATQNRRSL